MAGQRLDGFRHHRVLGCYFQPRVGDDRVWQLVGQRKPIDCGQFPVQL